MQGEAWPVKSGLPTKPDFGVHQNGVKNGSGKLSGAGLRQRRTIGGFLGAVLALLVLTPTALNAQAASPLMPGADYAQTRAALEKQGYQPLNFRSGKSDQCTGFDDICKAHPEIINCSGTGFNPCRFAYRAPDGGYLVGTASGEVVADLRLDALGAANAEDSRAIENILAGRPEYADASPASSADATASPQPAPEMSAPAEPAGSDDQPLQVVLFGGLIAVGLALYLLPAIIAFRRQHRYRWPILAFNVGAAWTGLGWIGTLVWAVWPSNSAIADPIINDATGPR